VLDLVDSSNASLADPQGNQAKPGISALGSWVSLRLNCPTGLCGSKFAKQALIGCKVNRPEAGILGSVTQLLMFSVTMTTVEVSGWSREVSSCGHVLLKPALVGRCSSIAQLHF